MKKLLIPFYFLFMYFQPAQGQRESILSPGSPFITNYTDDDYLDLGKNWGIAQGEDGQMYFANNYGLVQFDGYEWQQIGQPNNQSELRSFIIADDRIYIGGTSEIGYFEKDKLGVLNYVELNQLITDSTFTFNDVWDIAWFKERVFFLTDYGILMYANDSIQVLGKGIPFRSSTYGIDELVFGANERGLFRYTENDLEELTDPISFDKIQIEFLLTIQPGNYLIGTNTKGILKYNDGKIHVWNPENQPFFLENHPREVSILNKDHLLFGSLHGGIILTDYQGNVVNVINENNGLLDHNIRSIFKDKQGNIWTAVDGSVAYVEFNSPFTILNKKNGLRGAVSCILKQDNHLYVGTSRGLYIAEWHQQKFNNITFSLIPNTTGQCWQLFEHEGQILLGHHNGIYTINQSKATFIGGKGNWNFAEIPNQKNVLLSGNYSGITLLEKTGNGYVIKRQLEGFNETARELLFDKDENIWISHGYIGIYKMRLSDDLTAVENVQLYGESKGLPSYLYNNLISLEKGIFFGTQNGVYQYNEAKDRMELNPLFAPILKEETLVRKLYEIPGGNYLSIKDYDRTDEIELIEILEDGSFTLTEKPFQKLRGQFIPAFEAINFPNDEQILFGGKQGLIVYDTQFGEMGDKAHQCFISEVSLPLKDSVLFSGNTIYQPEDEIVIKVNSTEPIEFSFATSFFEALPYMNYSTYLEGFDESWQDWTLESERIFSNLPAGSYTFWVKSKNIYDDEGQSASFAFKIERESILWGTIDWWQFALIAIVLVAISYFFWARVRKVESRVISLEASLEQKKEKITQYKARKSAWKEEKEQINQKLSNVLLQNEIHAGLIQNIEKLSKKNAEPKDYKKAISEFQNNIKEVQLQMDAHNSIATDDFLTKIKTAYPDLSARELRLCSYLKLNVSSKEIAEYLCISIRGVESLRYRVRKKLGLSKGQDLTAFILDF